MDEQGAQINLCDVKELRERWFTKSELLKMENHPMTNMNQIFRNQIKTISNSPPNVKTPLDNMQNTTNPNTNQNPMTTD